MLWVPKSPLLGPKNSVDFFAGNFHGICQQETAGFGRRKQRWIWWKVRSFKSHLLSHPKPPCLIDLHISRWLFGHVYCDICFPQLNSFVMRSLHDLLILGGAASHPYRTLGWSWMRSRSPKHTVHKVRSWSHRYIPIGVYAKHTTSSGWNKLTHSNWKNCFLLPPQEAFLLVWGLENQAGQSKGANESSRNPIPDQCMVYLPYICLHWR